MAPPVLPCLLITGSPASHAVAAQLRGWAADGLLLPFAVVELGDVAGIGGPAPVMPGHLIEGAATPVSQDLLRLVAGGRWGHVLLLALFDTAASAELDPHDLAVGVAVELLNAMPMQPDLRGQGSHRLTAVRLFAPASDGGRFPRDWAGYHEIWDASLVLSPEDRLSPDSVADHVRWPGNYASHVAGAVAALTGDWFGFGLPCLPLPDRAAEGSGTPEPAVHVIRVQNRVAAAVLPLEPVADRAIAVAQGDEPPPPDAMSGLRRVGPASSKVLCRRASAAVLQHPSQTLRYQPVAPAPPERDVDISASELFNSYFRFAFGRQRSMKRAKGQFRGALWEPVQRPWLQLRRWLERVTQSALEGQGTGRRLRIVNDLPGEMAQTWVQRWQRAAGWGGGRPDAFDPDADAVFWGELRSWTLGLVDGQRPDVDPEHVSVVDVVSDRRLVIDRPTGDVFGEEARQLLTDPGISVFDVHTGERVAAELDQALHAAAAPPARPTRAAPSEGPSDGLLRRPVLWAAAGCTGLLLAAFLLGSGLLPGAAALAGLGALALAASFLLHRSSGGDDEQPEPAAEIPQALEAPPLIEVTALGEPDEALREALQRTEAELAAWLAQYRATMLGGLAASVAHDLDEAEADGREYRRQFEAIRDPDFSVLRKRSRAWVVWFWLSIGLWILGMWAVARWYRPLAGRDLVIPLINRTIPYEDFAIAGAAAVTLTALLMFFRALARYYKAYQQARRRLRDHAQGCSYLVRRRDHAEAEAGRLRSVNQRLATWAETYAWVLLDTFDRHPAAGQPAAGAEAVATPDGQGSAETAAEVPEPPRPAEGALQQDPGEASEPSDSAGPDGQGTAVPAVVPADAAVPVAVPEPVPAAAPPPPSPPRAPRASDSTAPQDERTAQPESGALATQLREVAVTAAFEESEVRSAVAAVASRGFAHELFLALVGHAFRKQGLSAPEVVREMDRDGRAAASVLAMFLTQLRNGRCRALTRQDLEHTLAQLRASEAASPGGDFSAMRVRGATGTTVEDFLAGLQGPGSALHKQLFGPLAQVEALHQVRAGWVWTHLADGSSRAGERLPRVILMPIDPDPDRLQVQAVRVDSTGPIHPRLLTCFTDASRGDPVRLLRQYDHESGLV